MSVQSSGLGHDGGRPRSNSPERLTYTVDEVGRLLGLSRNSAYQRVADGQIPTIRMGRRLLVPKAALDRLLETAAPHMTNNTDVRK
jgi:excisionase family DNA binding protein